MITSLKGIKCPTCGRKGLHFVPHPHAFGYKDYDRAECRFCHKRFKIKEENCPIVQQQLSGSAETASPKSAKADFT